MKRITRKEIRTPYKRMKNCKETWFKRGIKIDKESIIVKAGFDEGPQRAIAYNIKTKQYRYIT